MKRTNRRRLVNLFAFAMLAFAIYLTVFHKEEESAPAAKTTAKVVTKSHH